MPLEAVFWMFAWGVGAGVVGAFLVILLAGIFRLRSTTGADLLVALMNLIFIGGGMAAGFLHGAGVI